MMTGGPFRTAEPRGPRDQRGHDLYMNVIAQSRYELPS